MSDFESESMVESVIDEAASERRIKNPDNVVGLCSECKSTQPNQYMERNVFAQEGHPVPCKYCGGVVVITYGELQGEALNNRLDTSRGIGHG